MGITAEHLISKNLPHFCNTPAMWCSLIQKIGPYIWAKWNSLLKIKLDFVFKFITDWTYRLQSWKHQKSVKVRHHCAWGRKNLRSNSTLQRKANKIPFVWDLCLGKESKRKTFREGNNKTTSFSRLNRLIDFLANYLSDALKSRQPSDMQRKASFSFLENTHCFFAIFTQVLFPTEGLQSLKPQPKITGHLVKIYQIVSDFSRHYLYTDLGPDSKMERRLCLRKG